MTSYITLSALNALEVFDAKENFNKQRRSSTYYSSFNIDNSMHWIDTPQGFEYWQKLHHFALNKSKQIPYFEYFKKIYIIPSNIEIHIKLTEM